MNPRIKIIKFAEREQMAKARTAKRLTARSHVAQVGARDAAWTITGWIDEMQKQKHLNFEVAHALLGSPR